MERTTAAINELVARRGNLSSKSKGLFVCCNPSPCGHELDEYVTDDGTQDTIELRRGLREKLGAAESAWQAQEKELGELRQRSAQRELSLQQQYIGKAKDNRKKIVERFALAISRSNAMLLQLTFHGWSQQAARMAFRDRLLKQSASALVGRSGAGVSLALYFGSWLTLSKKHRSRTELKREAMMRRIGANFAAKVQDGILRLLFSVWLAVAKSEKHTWSAGAKSAKQPMFPPHVQAHFNSVASVVPSTGDDQVYVKVAILQGKKLFTSTSICVCEVLGQPDLTFQTDPGQGSDPLWEMERELRPRV